MGLGNIMQSAGALVRASSEMTLFQNENRKRVGVDSSLSRSRAEELNARAKETDDGKRKSIDSFFQMKAADYAEEAAAWALVGAVASVAGSIGSAATKSGANALDTTLAAVGGAFQIAGAILAYVNANQEANMVEEAFNKLSETTREDQDSLGALDGNPVI